MGSPGLLPPPILNGVSSDLSVVGALRQPDTGAAQMLGEDGERLTTGFPGPSVQLDSGQGSRTHHWPDAGLRASKLHAWLGREKRSNDPLIEIPKGSYEVPDNVFDPAPKLVTLGVGRVVDAEEEPIDRQQPAHDAAPRFYGIAVFERLPWIAFLAQFIEKPASHIFGHERLRVALRKMARRKTGAEPTVSGCRPYPPRPDLSGNQWLVDDAAETPKEIAA
jgi:hypothetical protein